MSSRTSHNHQHNAASTAERTQHPNHPQIQTTPSVQKRIQSQATDLAVNSYDAREHSYQDQTPMFDQNLRPAQDGDAEWKARARARFESISMARKLNPNVKVAFTQSNSNANVYRPNAVPDPNTTNANPRSGYHSTANLNYNPKATTTYDNRNSDSNMQVGQRTPSPQHHDPVLAPTREEVYAKVLGWLKRVEVEEDVEKKILSTDSRSNDR